MTLTPAELDQMSLLNLRLKEMLRERGFRKGDGVSGAGLKIVKALANEHGLRDWPYTRNAADYRALIAAVERHFEEDGK